MVKEIGAEGIELRKRGCEEEITGHGASFFISSPCDSSNYQDTFFQCDSTRQLKREGDAYVTLTRKSCRESSGSNSHSVVNSKYIET